MPKRMFIESDVLREDELNDAKRTVYYSLPDLSENERKSEIFDTVIEHAWHNPEKAWQAILEHDEIYANSSLVPLAGGYTGAPVVMDTMMRLARQQKVTNKSLFFLVPKEDIWWHGIDTKLLKKCFAEGKNKLYCINQEHSEFELINVKNLRL